MALERVLLACATAWLGGCSLVPYQSNDPCQGTGYGKCVSASQAYGEAVSGVPAGPEIEPGPQVQGVDAVATAEVGGRGREPERVGYKASVYRELTSLIDEPVTPMVRTPPLVRLLVMPYPGDRAGVKALYMPRTIYFMAKDPEFVLGDYLVRPHGGGLELLGK